MVEADYPFPHANDAPKLQQYLDDLIKDQVHYGCLHLLELQVRVCEQRVAALP